MNWFTSKVRRLWHWLRGLPMKVTIPAAIVVVVAISVGGYFSAHFYNYMQHDPDFCKSCHIMEESWDRWFTSDHSDVECHSCHHQSLFASAGLLIDFAFGGYERIEDHAVVPDDTCEKCHESGDPRWIQVAATSGHEQHAEEQNVACTKCHSITLHRFEPPGAICNVCHEEKHTEIGGMAEMHCTACHQYLVDEEKLLPLRKGCLDCHQALTELGVTWSTEAPMQYPCGDCHQPHEQAEPLVDCSSCHDVEGMHLEGAHRASSCETCHQAHEWQAARRDTCLTCHPGQAEHHLANQCSDCHQFR